MNLIGRVLPQTDLSYGVSVALGNEKYRHYKVSLTHLMLTDKSAEDLIRERISQDFGPDATLTILPETTSVGSALISESIVYEKTNAVLKQIKTNQLIYQYNKNISIFPDGVARTLYRAHKLLFSPTIRRLNRIILSLNAFIFDRIRTEEPADGNAELMDLEAGKFRIPLLPNWGGGFVWAATPVVYLARLASEDTLDREIDLLYRDLGVMVYKDLIMGHHTMPSVITVANLLGDGKQRYVVYAMPILNTDSLMKTLNIKSPIDLNYDITVPLRQLGVECAVREGGIFSSSQISDPFEGKLESVVHINSEDVTFIDDSKPSDIVRAAAKKKAEATLTAKVGE